MADTLQGICITCNDGPICVRRKSHGKPVWFCEEFDDYTPSPVLTALSCNMLSSSGSFAKFKIEGEKPVEHSGLCVNCDNREKCSFPKLGSEIWQCNEYI